MIRRRIPVLLLLGAFALANGSDSSARERVEASCAAITKALEAYLGPKFEKPVPVKLVTPQFIADFAVELEEAMTPGDSADAATRLAERLHQIPPGYDLRTSQIEMLKMQVAGLYDADKDCFYVVDRAANVDSPLFTVTAAHELIHAYRDVDKDFWPRLVAAIEDDADWAIAISCLAEGDATLLGQAVGTATLQQRPPDPLVALTAANAERSADAMRAGYAAGPLKEFPFALREMFIGRYAAGLRFAATVYLDGGIAALDAAFDRPPRSTEQILHPRKYLDEQPDEPTLVLGADPTAALGEGWQLSLSNVMGEFEVGVLFAEVLGRERARQAAAGWDGARYHFCEREATIAFVGVSSVWDTERDAQEFGRAWIDWAQHRDGKDRHAEKWRVMTSKGEVRVRVDGKRVLVADGIPEGRADAVFEALGEFRTRERGADEKPPPAK